MSDETLLEEIRGTFDSDVREWADIRKAGSDDMVMVADGPWSEKERKARIAADRPCLSFDELGQYINQTIGDARQKKRAIKVTPKGNGADDKSALKRAGMIREIEYQSNAQTAYMCGFESLLKRGYGYFKLGTRFCKPGSFDQELTIDAVPNPDVIYLDPFAKKPDWSDGGHGFEIDHFAEKAFIKRWPKAQIQSFEGEAMISAPAWIGADRIQVASYWRVEKKTRRLLRVGDKNDPKELYLDQLPEGARVADSAVTITLNGQTHRVPILNDRSEETPTVCQYITNGLEILEKNPQKWTEVPIIPFFGPEEYVDTGGGSKRRLLSMVRKARDAFMSYCYVKTNEVEVVGMVPKVLYMGYEGQFNTKTPWDEVNKIALPYGEVKAITTATGQTILPLPQRTLYDPPVEALERAAASFRLAIQSAMGIGSMLNGKDTQNQDARSGKAIDALDRQESQGTFIYISNFERGIERGGRMLEGGLDWCYDTPREVGSRSPSDAYSTLKVNQDTKDDKGRPERFNTEDGDHGVTLSVGPSDQSTRDAADDFVTSLMTLPNLPPKIMALGVKLKNLGPIGDEIAEAFDPQEAGPDPQQQAQQMQALQQKLATTEKFAQSLHEQIETKAAELASREKIAAMQEETKRVLGLAQIDQKDAIVKLEEELNIVHRKVDKQHELTVQAIDHAHEANQTQRAQDHDRLTQAADQAHATATQGADQAHEAAQQSSAQDATAQQATQAQEAAAEQPKAA